MVHRRSSQGTPRQAHYLNAPNFINRGASRRAPQSANNSKWGGLLCASPPSHSLGMYMEQLLGEGKGSLGDRCMLVPNDVLATSIPPMAAGRASQFLEHTEAVRNRKQ